MTALKKMVLPVLFGFSFLFCAPCFGDETELFSGAVSSSDPRALIVFDLSWSMDYPILGCPNSLSVVCSNVAGADCQCSIYPKGCMYCVYRTAYDSSADPYCRNYDGPYQSTSWTPETPNPCKVNSHEPNAPVWGDSTCSPPYYRTRGPGHMKNCRRVNIAKEAIYKVLNADPADPAVNTNDERSLGAKLGYITFGPAAPTVVKNLGAPYADIWNSVSAEYTFGGTYLVDALDLAKRTHDADRQADPSNTCSQRFVILVTDGADTYACFSSGGGKNFKDYMRRRSTVAKAKELSDAGYKVFVIGFGGDMAPEDRNTLNWTAYYGGTDNPITANSGNTGTITPSSDPCNSSTSNDPGTGDLGGYAYWAENAPQFELFLKSTMDFVKAARYSFSLGSVAAHRLTGESFLFEASFVPANNDPFWTGNLRKYNLNSDGSVGTMVWNAGEILKNKPASERNIFTYLDGVKAEFKCLPPGDWKKYLGVQTGTGACDIMDYVRGEAAKNPEGWKLGDIFHSNPITIGSPSPYFTDILSPTSFASFRENRKNRERIIVAGANDGQFRAFSAGTGDEKWSFIPPNLLPKLKYLAHFEHTGSLPAHMYFADGPVMVADVWLGSGTGTDKNSNDWRTMLVFSEGRGARNSANGTPDYLWSASPNCDVNFNLQYDADHPFYCGYWAFDVTDTSAAAPTFKWRLNPNATQALYLGEPWSRMAIGRVKISGNEKWVGFMGGGYNPGDPDRGKGFFVVDLSNGNILWSYTRGATDTVQTSASMTYSLPASPAVVDTDNDGFVDTAYVGDLGGNLWRFKFCLATDGNTCGVSNWRGGKFFESEAARPIFTTPSATRDSGHIWVFWGTGDKESPSLPGSQDLFFALKDDDRSSSYDLADLQNMGASVFDSSYPGWYIPLASGEKVLTESSVFAGMATWTTFSPAASNGSCSAAGAAKLYAVAVMPIVIGGVTYEPGAGVFAVTNGRVPGTRAVSLGAGIAQMPIYSQKPGGSGGADAYVTSSGVGAQDASIQSSQAMADSPFKQRLRVSAPAAQVIHWWDRRMQ